MEAINLQPTSGGWGRRFGPVLLACAFSLGCVTITDGGPAPKSVRAAAQRDVGLDYLSMGSTALAIRELQQADLLSPDDPEILVWLGEGYRRKGRLDEAQAYMEQALALSPQSHVVRLNLSGLYIQMEQYDDAIEQVNVLMADATYASPWQALNNRGWAEFQAGRFDAAEASYEEALDYHPRYWPSLLNLGILASQRGDKQGAVEHFNQVLDRGPDAFALAETNYRIGEVYISWGHRDKAIGHFESALENSPYSRWAEQSQDYLDLLQ